MRMAGVKFSSVLFLVVILAVMGWFMQTLLGQTTDTVRADNAAARVETAQPATGKVRIGIGGVKVLPSLEQQLQHADQGFLIRRASETIEGQLMDALQNTRKFEIVARNDLDELLKEQNLRSGAIIDSADAKAAAPGKIKGLQYLILTTIDDFVDNEQQLYAQEMGMAVNSRTMRISAIVRIYDTTTGVLMESMSIPVQMQASGATRAAAGETVKNGAAVDNSAYVALINQLAQRVSQRAVDILFPAKVVAVTGSYITINRGAGTAIDRNQLWEVFSAGQDMKDPDTGESLGREELKVGEIVVTDVLPRSAKAQIYGENRGISVGDVVRMKIQTEVPQPAQATTAAPTAK